MDGSGDRQNIFPTGDGETGNPSSVNGRNPTAMVNNEEWDLDKLDYNVYEKCFIDFRFKVKQEQSHDKLFLKKKRSEYKE